MDEIDIRLSEIYEKMEQLAKERDIKLTLGRFDREANPDISVLWDEYQEFAEKYNKTPLGWASPEGGWAMSSSWITNNCRFANQNDESKTDLEVPEFLYHATYLPLMKNIRKLGLGTANIKNWEESQSKVVYLAKDPFVAESYAETSETVPEEWLDQIVILKINTSNMDHKMFFVDRNNLAKDTIEYHGTIPPSNITILR